MKSLFALTVDEQKMFIRILLVALAVTILVSVGFKLAHADDVLPGKILVTYKDGTTGAEKDLFRSTYKLQLASPPTTIPNTDLLIITDGKDPKDLTILLSTHPIVKHAEPVFTRKPQGQEIPNDFDYKYQWYMDKINMPDVYYYQQYTMGWSRPALWVAPRIAIIDSGIVKGNLDMPYNNIIWGCDWTDPGVTCKQPLDTVVGSSHGMAIASIIAAHWRNGVGIAGMDLFVSLIIEKACDDYENCLTSDVAQGIYHAVSLGAKVINLSLAGTSYSAIEEDAINYAVAKGALVVCAAGNDGLNMAIYPYYPAILPGCMTVGATDKSDYYVQYGADYYGTNYWGTNFGKNISVMAPGVDIYAESDSEYYSITQWQGTSFSTALVTGLAGLVLDKCQNIPVSRVRHLIEAGVAPLSPEVFYGHGRINAIKSLMAPCLAPPAPPAPPDLNRLPVGSYYPKPTCKNGICAF